MEEFESEMEKLLASSITKCSVEDLAGDCSKINRKDQSSSEYDDEDDDDFGDEDDELLENDKLMSSLPSNEGYNPVKGGVMKPHDKRNYSKEYNFSEAIECTKEIDIIVAECQLCDGNVVHEATNEFTGVFLKNNIQTSEKRQRRPLTGSDNENCALEIYSSSSGDLPELHSIECVSEIKLSDFAPTDYSEQQQYHHGVVITEDNYIVKPLSGNASDLPVLENMKLTPLEDEADKLIHYIGSTLRHDDELPAIISNSKVANGLDFTESVQQKPDVVMDDNGSLGRSAESHFEEPEEQLQELRVNNYEYQAYIGSANAMGAVKIVEQLSPIEKVGMSTDRPDVMHRAPELNSIEILKEHNLPIFKYDDSQHYLGKACYVSDCSDFKSLKARSLFEEDGEIMYIANSEKISSKLELDIFKDDKFHDYFCGPVLLSHPGAIMKCAEQQSPTEQIEIGKDFPYSANNSSMLPTTKSLQRRQQPFFGDEENLDVGSPNDLKSKLGCINCDQIVENENNVENNPSPKGSPELFCSAGDAKACDTLRPHRESVNPPNVESGYFESSDSPYSTDMPVSRKDTIGPMQHLQYDQVVSESLRNQLNRFDLLIETIDQRNARNMAKNVTERGYWSTIFGQASEIEAYDEMSTERKAHRALELLEDYHSRLSEPQDRALRIAIERVIRIFKSRLFQALLGKYAIRIIEAIYNPYQSDK